MIEAQGIAIESLKSENADLKLRHKEMKEVQDDENSSLKKRLAALESSVTSLESSPAITPTSSIPNSPQVRGKKERRAATLLRSIANPATSPAGQFGGALDAIMTGQNAKYPNEELPKSWTTLIRLLHETNALKEEGIFRKSGALGDILKLKEMLNRGDFGISKEAFEKKYHSGDVHVIACALKQFITELSTELIPPSNYEDAINCLSISDEASCRIVYIYELINSLPVICSFFYCLDL